MVGGRSGGSVLSPVDEAPLPCRDLLPISASSFNSEKKNVSDKILSHFLPQQISDRQGCVGFKHFSRTCKSLSLSFQGLQVNELEF